MKTSRFFFFFQAEDGIRDFHVTGVQTCALPISHGELITGGAYVALTLLWVLTALAGWELGRWGALSFGWPFVLLLVAAMAGTAALALGLERVLFRPLRRRGTMIGLVIASFGASLALRSLVAFAWGPEPQYYARAIPIAREVLPGVRVTADQLFVLVLTAALILALDLRDRRRPRRRRWRAHRSHRADPAAARLRTAAAALRRGHRGRRRQRLRRAGRQP